MNKSILLAILCIIITTISFAEEGIILSSTNTNSLNQAAGKQPVESLDAICNASNETFKEIQSIVEKLNQGNLDHKDAESKLTEIKRPWENRNLTNRCNDYRSNGISCPATSQDMKLIRISDSMIAIVNILSYKAEHAFSPKEIKTRYEEARTTHQNLCNSLKSS